MQQQAASGQTLHTLPINHLPKGVYMLEVNTIPGQSEASIVPQQVKAIGWNLKEFYTKLIQESFSKIG